VTLAAHESNTGALPTPESGAARGILDYDPPMAHFLVNLGAIELVERIAFRTCDRQMDVWVMLKERSLPAEEQIYRLDYEYRRAGGRADIDLHVVSLDRTDPGVLPAPDFVVERTKG
jgi:hypothetical protein